MPNPHKTLRRLRRGKRHGNWKGKAAGYTAIHIWLTNNFGRPTRCVWCGLLGDFKNGRWTVEWANITGDYTRNREDYIWLCRSCHCEYDKTSLKRSRNNKGQSCMKKALIFGISGMDGSHMADLLLEKGYEVHGFVRRSSRGYGALENIKHLVNDDKIYRKRLLLHAGDLDDGSSIDRVIKELQPDECYSYAAQADVQESFLMPEYSVMINSIGPLRILEAIKRLSPRTKFYQASTSELFGDVGEHKVQNEKTPFNPQSPYAIGKLAAYHLTKKYREAYGLFAVNGLTFNHCSERRTSDYLDRKVTRAVGRIKAGLQKELRLGNLQSYRDWTYAPEMVEAHWKMLQLDKPEDLVLGTGITHQVQEWVDTAFEVAGLKASEYVVIDPHLFRPAEVNILLADCTKAKQLIGWEPKVGFKEIIERMVKNDIELAKKEI